MESTAGRHGIQTRHRAVNLDETLVTRHQARDRADQSARVGMLRPADDVIDRPDFDDAPGIHYRHAVGGFRDHAHVVGNQHHGGSPVAADAFQQRGDLCLDRKRRNIDAIARSTRTYGRDPAFRIGISGLFPKPARRIHTRDPRADCKTVRGTAYRARPATMRSVPRFRCKHQAGFEQMHMWILPPGQRPMLVLGPAARRIGESRVDGREQNFDLLAIGDAVRGCEKGGER